MTLSIQFCLYRLRVKMKKYLLSKNQKNKISDLLRIENVKRFDHGMSFLKESILKVAKSNLDLWETLQDNIPDLSKLLDSGTKGI